MTRLKPWEVDDELWAVIEPLLPALPPPVGRREPAGGETASLQGGRAYHDRYTSGISRDPRAPRALRSPARPGEGGEDA